MNILMMTNTYSPHVGGVARSVERFAAAYRRRGHEVLVVAPEFEDMPRGETGVLRIPAIQNFNGSDFSVVLPVSLLLVSALDRFRPDIVHAHHPFLIGATAVRVASSRGLPLVFTHHTLYERYTHYVPGDSPALQRFVIDLSTSYANLCDQIFAPSRTIADLLRRRGVTAPISEVPTGLDLAAFHGGDGTRFRTRYDIPADAFLVGHIGRLAPEKNLAFLARAVVRFLRATPTARFAVVGGGPSEAAIRAIFAAAGLADRLVLTGTLTGDALVDAYRAMDVFAFASQSETQGMVLTEAMACGVPVVAVDAPGVREVVRDGENGRLLPVEDEAVFSAALADLAGRDTAALEAMQRSAEKTAEAFAIDRCADLALGLYRQCLDREVQQQRRDETPWERAMRLITAEWELLKGVAGATGAALGIEDTPEQ
ncbi:MAG: glycosyltransferase [Inquilinus sp.]|nr:glycosyltransferase [Inquilinus sp.]